MTRQPERFDRLVRRVAIRVLWLAAPISVAVLAGLLSACSRSPAPTPLAGLEERFADALTATAAVRPTVTPRPTATPTATATPLPTPTPTPLPTPTSTPTPVPVTGTFGYTATLLNDGRVLVIDRYYGARLFDSADGSYTVVPYSRRPYRNTATLLPDGSVFIYGGLSVPQNTQVSQIYEPSLDEILGAPASGQARYFPSAVLLASCDVLAIGGMAGRTQRGSVPNSAEIYVTKSRLWRDGGIMQAARDSPAAVRLLDGRVLAIGGGAPGGEVFDPSNRVWTAVDVPAQVLSGPAMLTGQGTVLVMANEPAETVPWTGLPADAGTAGWFSGTARPNATQGSVTTLPDGRVLVLGGRTRDGHPTDAVDIYDPVTGIWTGVTPLQQPRVGAVVTVLGDGRVLLIGGGVLPPGEPVPEIYSPPPADDPFPPVSPLVNPAYCESG